MRATVTSALSGPSGRREQPARAAGAVTVGGVVNRG